MQSLRHFANDLISVRVSKVKKRRAFVASITDNKIADATNVFSTFRICAHLPQAKQKQFEYITRDTVNHRRRAISAPSFRADSSSRSSSPRWIISLTRHRIALRCGRKDKVFLI